MFDSPHHRRLLTTVVDAVRWKVEHNRSIPDEHVIGPATAMADDDARFSVDLRDRPFDENAYPELSLRLDDGSRVPVGVPVANTGSVVLIDGPSRDVSAADPTATDATAAEPVAAEPQATDIAPEKGQLLGLHDPTFPDEALADALAARPTLGPGATVLDGRLDPTPSDLRGSKKDLNDRQRRAVAAVLSPGVQVIWGPPGSGKRRVIIEAMSEAFDEELSVLFVSTSKDAVDQTILSAHAAIDPRPGAIIRTGTPRLDAVINHPSLSLDRAVQVRRRELAKRRNEVLRRLDAIDASPEFNEWTEVTDKLEDLDPAAVQKTRTRLEVEQRALALDAWIATLAAQSESNAAFLVELDGKADRLERLANSHPAHLWTERDMLAAEDEATEAAVKSRARATEASEAELDVARSARDSANRFNFNERMKLVAEVGRRDTAHQQRLENLLRAERDRDRRRALNAQRRAQIDAQLPDSCDQDWWDLLRRSRTEIRAALSETTEAERKLQAEMAECRRALEPLQDDPPTDEDRDLINKLLPLQSMLLKRQEQLEPVCAMLWDEEEALHDELTEIDNELDQLRRHVTEQAQIIASTLESVAMTPEILRRAFDVVIVDEVSVASLPALVLVATLAKSSVALVGDLDRLDPVFEFGTGQGGAADEPTDQETWWLVAGTFDHFGLLSTDDAREHPGCAALL